MQILSPVLCYDRAQNFNWTALVLPRYPNSLGTLLATLRASPNPSVPSILRLLASLARAVAELHSFNIAHGNLKPANVLINDNWEVSLCDVHFKGRLNNQDFGSTNSGARVGGSASAGDTLEASECVPPEEDMSKAADTWAIGCMLLMVAYF